MSPKKTKKQSEKPRIIRSAKGDRGEKPNTCRACAGSKFC